MTKEEILKIKEHIEIHARRERGAVMITEILWKAVDELEHITDIEKENHQLKQQLENEKQLNAEIKKRLVEVEYDCEEFNHEYCDPNCNGKRKETIDLLQLISDGLNETLLKQKDTEIEQLKEQIKDLESQLKDVIEDNDYYQKENEKMKNHTNCKFYHEWNLANVMEEPLDDLSPCQGCKNFSLWELTE